MGSLKLAAGLLLAGAVRSYALAPSDATAVDKLYFSRDQPSNLALSVQRLQADLAAQPQDEPALWRCGRSLVAQADAASGRDAKLALFKQAEDVLRAAVKLAPGDAQAHYWLAREMGGSNDILRTLALARSMRKELETAIALDPGLAAAHRILAELLRQLPGLFGGDKQRAVREAEEALRLAPNDTANYPALAQAYLAVGKKPQAIDALQRAFQVAAPDDPAAAAGDLQDARALLNKLSPPRQALLQGLERPGAQTFRSS